MNPRIALLFPGQGSQYPGMGRELHDAFPEARAVWARANETLGFDLAKIAFEGPEEELKKTLNTQPALFAASLATLAVLEARGLPVRTPVVAAGHSLGEYTALASAGAMDAASGIAIVRRRGELMWDSGVTRPGGMAAILGMSLAEVEEVCAAASSPDGASVVVAANHNAPKQVVVSGDRDAVKRAAALAREKGARRAIELEVSGAFHSPLMRPAAEGLRAALGATAIAAARFPVVANVDAAPKQDAAGIRDALERQLTSAVRWVGSMETMAAMGVDLFVEVGPGKVLSGLARQVAPDARVANVENLESLALAEEAMNALRGAERGV